MRIPVAVNLESRDGTVLKDAKVVNGIVEPRGDQPILRKRPGLADLGQIWRTGRAQLLYVWNGLWAIYGDYLTYGTVSTIVAQTFTTLNPSDKGSSVTLSNGNLTAAFAVNVNVNVRSTDSKAAGKFYWEVTVTAASVLIGIAKSGAALTNYLGFDTNGWAYQPSGNKLTNNVSSAYGSSITTGDVIGVALDIDAGTLIFYKNNVSQGTAFTGLSGTFFAAVSGNGAATGTATMNLGASALVYAPPTGYTAGIPTSGTYIGPTTSGLRFDAQEVGASAATQLMMIKNRTQAWTVTKAGVRSAVSFPSSMGAATYAVASLTRSGSTATASLSTDPGVNIGDSITVAGAGDALYNVTATVTASTPYSSFPAQSVPITITRSGTTATATSVIPHGLTNGSTYTISGAGQSAYNVTTTVTVAPGDTFVFSYTVSVTAYSLYGAGVTWNAADKGPSITLSAGNLTASAAIPTSTTTEFVRATTGISSGAKYWEVTVNQRVSTCLVYVGVAQTGQSLTAAPSGATHYLQTAVSGDIVGVVLNMDAGTVAFYINGVLIGQVGSLSGTYYPIVGFNGGSSTTQSVTANFGATAATYNYDSPGSPATGSTVVARPASTVNATVSYTVAGSPTSPAAGTITLTTNGGMVPGLPYIDGYFFVMDNNGVMWTSAIDDPTSWPALNNLTAQNENGKGKALYKSANYLVAFKEWSTEFFYDAKQSPGFPFLPVDNGFTQIGCASGESVARIDGKLIWVSQVRERGRSIHIMAGMEQQAVSTPDVERILNNDDFATVYAYGLKLGGHSLYILTLGTTGITLVYDLSSQFWYQWTSFTARTPVSVSSITFDSGVGTVTAAHGLNDGDPVLIAGAGQNEYNGIFQASVTSSTVFTIPVTGAPVTPATGTITATGYTGTYFKLLKYADYQGLNLFLHESDGHLYQMLPTLFQDNGLPIDLIFRTTRLDGGSSEVKAMGRLTVIGDSIADTLMVRQSDDDATTYSAYRRVNLSLERPTLRRLGKFRRRTIMGRHIGNTNPRLEAIELEIE